MLAVCIRDEQMLNMPLVEVAVRSNIDCLPTACVSGAHPYRLIACHFAKRTVRPRSIARVTAYLIKTCSLADR